MSNKSTLMSIDDWLKVIRKEIKREDHFPIIAIGIVPEREEYREVTTEDGIKIAKSRGLDGFIECSSKSGDNVEKAFMALTRLMLEKHVEIKIQYPNIIEDILLFMFNRKGRYKRQITYAFLKGKIINHRDEEVKEGFDWLKNNNRYIDQVSTYSIKINDEGLNLLKKLNKI